METEQTRAIIGFISEKPSKQFGMYFRPSTYRNLQKIAKRREITVTQVIREAVLFYISKDTEKCSGG